ncbi:hypothetical protein BD779DRAFT_1568960 [Infundibulicybe gibba]|nr:hypothetical protein BD779DRAFT_1568960 [Infundibulicybe gibba]
MQGLFGVSFRAGCQDGSLSISASLGVLLKMGRVKLRPSEGGESGRIDDYMGDTHECLAISCAKYLASSAGSQGKEGRGSASWYAKRYWCDHLKRARLSERLFECYHAEPVIRWLEESPNIPKDILARWRATRVKHGTTHDPAPPRPPICIVDQMFERYYSGSEIGGENS